MKKEKDLKRRRVVAKTTMEPIGSVKKKPRKKEEKDRKRRGFKKVKHV